MLNKKYRLYIWLLGVNLFISSFTFGGGYVVVPMIKKYFVQKKKLFSEEELMSMAAVAQSTPGAIAVNLSALAGFQSAGIAGAVISFVAAVIPPLVILSAVSVGYEAFASNNAIAAILKGMQSGVAALIVELVVDMCAMVLKQKSMFLTLLIPASFVASFLLNINVAVVLVVACFLSIVHVFWKKGRQCI